MHNILIFIWLFTLPSVNKPECYWNNLPCLNFWSFTNESIANEPECELRRLIAFGLFSNNITRKILLNKLSIKDATSIFYETYQKMQSSDSEWPQYLHLADDVIYYQVKCLMPFLNNSEVDKLLLFIDDNHKTSTLCNLDKLDNKELANFFGGWPVQMKDNDRFQAMQQIQEIYVYNCTDNTLDSAIYDYANHLVFKGKELDSLQKYLKIVNESEPIKHNSIPNFIKSTKYELISVKLEKYEFYNISSYLYYDNIFAKSLRSVISLYLKTNQPSKALNLIDRYGKYQSLFWLKEVKPLIETYSKDKHLDFQRKLDETIWNAIRDAP